MVLFSTWNNPSEIFQEKQYRRIWQVSSHRSVLSEGVGVCRLSASQSPWKVPLTLGWGPEDYCPGCDGTLRLTHQPNSNNLNEAA